MSWLTLRRLLGFSSSAASSSADRSCQVNHQGKQYGEYVVNIIRTKRQYASCWPSPQQQTDSAATTKNLQLQRQNLAQQIRSTHKRASGSWGILSTPSNTTLPANICPSQCHITCRDCQHTARRGCHHHASIVCKARDCCTSGTHEIMPTVALHTYNLLTTKKPTSSQPLIYPAGRNGTHKAHVVELADKAARHVEWVLQVEDVFAGEGLICQQILQTRRQNNRRQRGQQADRQASG